MGTKQNNKNLISYCCEAVAKPFKTENESGYRCQKCMKKCELLKKSVLSNETKPVVKKDIKKEKETDRQTGKKEKYAYVIKDKIFGEFKVLNTANAWWIDTVKVTNLIEAYKIDATNEEACCFAGISKDQLEYFKSLHKDFSYIKHACKQLPTLTARKTINQSLNYDKDTAWKYLSKKRPDEFGNKIDITSGGETINKDNKIIFVDFEDLTDEEKK